MIHFIGAPGPPLFWKLCNVSIVWWMLLVWFYIIKSQWVVRIFSSTSSPLLDSTYQTLQLRECPAAGAPLCDWLCFRVGGEDWGVGRSWNILRQPCGLLQQAIWLWKGVLPATSPHHQGCGQTRNYSADFCSRHLVCRVGERWQEGGYSSKKAPNCLINFIQDLQKY